MTRLVVFAMEGGGFAVMGSSDVRRIVDYARGLRFVGVFDSVAERTLEDLDAEAWGGPCPAANRTPWGPAPR